MKRARLLTTAGAIALLVGTTANALTRTGKVVATDALTGAITVETDDGKQVVFTRNGATQLDVAKGALEQNARVTVTTDQTGTDPRTPMLATRVRVEEVAGAPAPDSASAVRVESAGKDGNLPSHTVQVESADYDETQAPPPRDRLPKSHVPLTLIAVVGAATFLAAGLALRLRRQV